MRWSRFCIVMTSVLCGMMLPAYAADSTGVNMKPRTPEDWRRYLTFRRDETLENLYKLKPEAKSVIERAKGYAVFSNFGMKIFIVGTGSGRGLVHDNLTGKETFMRMVQAGAGWGVGVKDFRAVFVFDDSVVMEDFMRSGWSFGSEVNAAAKGGDSGAATSGAIAVAPGLRVYQLTENGLMLDVMVNGTKYWVDKEMNKQQSN